MNATIPVNETNENVLLDALRAQRQAFLADGEVSAETRINRINRCIDLMVDNKDKLVAALSKDFGCRSPRQSLMADIYSTLEMAKDNRGRIARWMKPHKRKVALPLRLLGAKARVEYQPLGVVGIIGTWNFPIHVIFGPLIGVLAAGNRAMVKFSEGCPETSALLETLIARYFNPDEVCGFNGGPDVGAAFSALPFDHLLFTGATGVGKHILHAAADNLTPVTLELGGKSPVIIDDTITNITDVAERVIAAKILNSGQLCIAPDYVFVSGKLKDDFIREIKASVQMMFPKGMRDNPDFTSIVNRRHRERVQSYIDDAAAKGAQVINLNPANEDFSEQRETNKIPLTLVINPDDTMKVMQEEIFGPVLVIKTYNHLQECIDYINAHPRPLALYLFTKSAEAERQVLDNTRSGGVTLNDVALHVACEDLPLGGVGASGMGNYHGFEGFQTFSHARSIFPGPKWNITKLGGMLPPYGERIDKTLAGMIKK